MTATLPRAAIGTPHHVLSAADLQPLGMEKLLAHAQALREARATRTLQPELAGRQVALLFDKPSLRTKVSFDVGVELLGGHAVFLGADEVRLGQREPASDIGANLSRWVDAIVVRASSPGIIAELASASSVPVINALDDREHPCQALADMLTLRQQWGSLAGRTLAWVGDSNNVCHSAVVAAALSGMHVRVATPPEHTPHPDMLAAARSFAAARGASVQAGTDPVEAVSGADAVYTDVWTSMGFEAEAAARRARFAPFQVNASLLAHAPDALVMHCLPAHRGEEITAKVLDGPQSVALEQAENRMYAQQALLVALLA